MVTDVHHVHPAIAIGDDVEAGEGQVHISYYTQHSNETADLDMANSEDAGNTFPTGRTIRVTSTSFNLAPTNIPIPTATQPFRTSNYDRTVVACYNLGEYNGVFRHNSNVLAVWGDDRNTVTQPVNSLDPISGQTHPQEDTFFQIVKVD